jgi:hypothetical protein
MRRQTRGISVETHSSAGDRVPIPCSRTKQLERASPKTETADLQLLARARARSLGRFSRQKKLERYPADLRRRASFCCTTRQGSKWLLLFLRPVSSLAERDARGQISRTSRDAGRDEPAFLPSREADLMDVAWTMSETTLLYIIGLASVASLSLSARYLEHKRYRETQIIATAWAEIRQGKAARKKPAAQSGPGIAASDFAGCHVVGR